MAVTYNDTCGSIFQRLPFPSPPPLYSAAEKTGILFLVSYSVTNLLMSVKVWQITLYLFWSLMFPPSKISGMFGGVFSRKDSLHCATDATTAVSVGTMDRRSRVVRGRRCCIINDIISEPCVIGLEKNKDRYYIKHTSSFPDIYIYVHNNP